MRTVPKLVLTVMLVAIIVSCTYGFLATFEPPGSLAARLLYAIVAVACVAGIGVLWIAKFRRE
jgi:cytochrome c-type biogenesis protein CcmH/NrfF